MLGPQDGISVSFVRAERSAFRWGGGDEARIRELGHTVDMLPDSGHWVHTDNPQVSNFLHTLHPNLPSISLHSKTPRCAPSRNAILPPASGCRGRSLYDAFLPGGLARTGCSVGVGWVWMWVCMHKTNLSCSFGTGRLRDITWSCCTWRCCCAYLFVAPSC